MEWDDENTNEFADWWTGLSNQERDSIRPIVGLLEELGPNVPYPQSSTINGSKHSHMRELRIQHQGHPYRIL